MLGLSIALAVVIATGESASPNGDGAAVMIMPAKWLRPVNSALADFKGTHKNWECFDIVIIPQANVLQIGFSSKPRITEDPSTGAISIGPQTKCGRGAAYLVQKDGKIVKRLQAD